MRILFATNQTYLPQRAGGSESVTHDLCLSLKSRGFAVAVLAQIEPDGLLGISNRIKRKLYPPRQFPCDTVMGYPVYRGYGPISGVDEVLQNFAPTIAVVQAGTPMILVNAFLNAGVPTVLYLHDVELEYLGGNIVTHPLLLCIANSQFTAARFREVFAIRPHVIPPCISEEKYRVETNKSKVVFIGLIAKKGVELAFQLAKKRPDIPFQFVESWPVKLSDFLDFERRARALGNVTVRRRVADMRSIYSMAKILLVPSVCEEAWGRVCTEAQCSGIPVLASNRGGLPESVGPGGLLVDIHAPLSEWLDALSTMWDDTNAYTRLSEAALTHSRRPEIQSDYLVDKFVALLVDHLSGLSSEWASAKSAVPPDPNSSCIALLPPH